MPIYRGEGGSGTGSSGKPGGGTGGGGSTGPITTKDVLLTNSQSPTLVTQEDANQYLTEQLDQLDQLDPNDFVKKVWGGTQHMVGANNQLSWSTDTNDPGPYTAIIIGQGSGVGGGRDAAAFFVETENGSYEIDNYGMHIRGGKLQGGYGATIAGFDSIQATDFLDADGNSIVGGGGGFSDAPNDGQLYGRQSEAWAVVPAGGASSWNDLTDKPADFPPSDHTHEIDEVNGLQDALDAAGGTPAWDDVTGKPTEFPPEAHFHPISDVTGLQGALDGKASVDTIICGTY